MTIATHTVNLDGVGPVDVSVDDQGHGRPFLFLHGGGGPQTVSSFADSPRISRTVLIDAVGIEVPGHPVADFFSLSMDEVFALSFHNPDPFRIDPSTLPPAAQAVAAGNRAALAVYAGASMSDPRLVQRLSTLERPILVLWGDSDRIVDADYGRAFAAAIPSARFQLLENTGHMPQMETPNQTLQAIWEGVTEGGRAG
jgi:pimeloyl-ACP methyl ester carboxylesterase